MERQLLQKKSFDVRSQMKWIFFFKYENVALQSISLVATRVCDKWLNSLQLADCQRQNEAVCQSESQTVNLFTCFNAAGE